MNQVAVRRMDLYPVETGPFSPFGCPNEIIDCFRNLQGIHCDGGDAENVWHGRRGDGGFSYHRYCPLPTAVEHLGDDFYIIPVHAIGKLFITFDDLVPVETDLPGKPLSVPLGISPPP